MNLAYLPLAVPVSLAVELVVVSGAWAWLAAWWRRQNAWCVEDDEDYVVTSLFSYRKDGK